MNVFGFLAEILFIGHSLVGRDLPVVVEGGLRQMGEPATVSAQIINGAPLKFNLANPGSAEGVNGTEELAKGETEVLILTEAVPLAQQIQWNDTVGQVAAYALLARAGNADARVFVYETWASRKSGPGTVIEGDTGAGVPWRERLTAELPLWEGVVRDAQAKSGVPVALIPAGQALARLSDAVLAGAVPGVTSMDAFFSDDIHLSDKGIYFITLVHMAAISGKSPEGLPAKLTRSWKSREAVIDDPLARALQTIAWAAVSTYAPGPAAVAEPTDPLLAPLPDTMTDAAPMPTIAPNPVAPSANPEPASPEPAATPLAPAPGPAATPEPTPAPETLDPASFTPVTNPNLAIGLNGLADWTVQQPFLNVMKTAREWTGHLPDQFGGWNHARLAAAGALDANGWPLFIPPELTGISALMLTDLPPEAAGVAGTYVVTWQGRGTLTLEGRAQDVVMAEGQARFTFTPGDGTVSLTLRATDRDDPIRNIVVVREDRMGLLAAGQIFNPDWLARIRGVKTIRLMDWMRTNDSLLARLDDRPKPDDYTFTRLGAPIEVMAALANELDANPWFTLPHLAEDPLVRFYAEVARATLEPGLVAHVEYSNEVWNWQFAQATWAEEQGRARWGRDSTWVQFYALRASEVASIWTDVFGAEASTRLVRIIATQTGYLGIEDQILGAPDVVAEGLPAPATQFDAYAVTGYFSALLGSDAKVSVVRDWIASSEATARAASADQPDPEGYLAQHRYDQANQLAATELGNGSVTGDMSDSVDDLLGRILPHQAAVAAKHNLRLMMYEGGTHVVGYGATVDDESLTAFFTQFNYSPEMAALYGRVMDGWGALTPEPFNAFVDVSDPSKWGSWGALRHLGDENPRWDVLAKGCLGC